MAPSRARAREEWERERVRARVAAIFGDTERAAAMTGPLPPGHDPPPQPQPQSQSQSQSPRPRPQRAERAWLTVRERLPLWLQLRCGTDPRALAALALVLIVAVAFAVHHFWTGRPEPVRAPAVERSATGPDDQHRGPGRAADPHSSTLPSPASSSASSTGASGSADGAAGGPSGGAGRQLVVDVTGKVRHPGIHRMPPGSRVIDALRAAGGVLHGANVSGLNRARLLTDGEQIAVGVPGAAAGSGAGPGGAGAGGTGSGTAGGGAGSSGPVSLSAATEQQLDALPGVGPVLARHIIEFRTQHGGFTSVEQLRQVTGIGDRRFADLRPLVEP
ncbi:ComEA family DNA-binding protein [Streptomyces nigrescens]|uniref:ComEA family DNA-binding protein n=1 Tax=Streptomyces nigrescens TaxID=1920 RepID=UPI0021C4557C|nr:ComEA family DNA-binding protein [Streptomyces nigrescens]